jgi:hypothetical protein
VYLIPRGSLSSPKPLYFLLNEAVSVEPHPSGSASLIILASSLDKVAKVYPVDRVGIASIVNRGWRPAIPGILLVKVPRVNRVGGVGGVVRAGTVNRNSSTTITSAPPAQVVRVGGVGGVLGSGRVNRVNKSS